MTGLSRLKPRNLHVSHSWGGGVDRWVNDFCIHDRYSENLVLESVGSRDCYGVGVRLVEGRTRRQLGRWILRHPIGETRIHHPEYRDILRGICDDHEISHVYLSCLIGHSLDVLDLGIPVTKIHHDYYPCCPNIYMFYGTPCRGCDLDRLTDCLRNNPVDFARGKSSPRFWQELRHAYLEALSRPHVRQVCPSPSVMSQLAVLDERLRALAYTVIPHGINLSRENLFGGAEAGRRLRVAVLGTQHVVKGLDLLTRAFDRARVLVDLSFLGGGPEGRAFISRFGVSYLDRYDHGNLRSLLAEGGFDLALFASAFAETFCYTLSEVWACAIPPAAREVGSFLDRVHHGEDGFLIGPTAEDIVDLLLFASSHRECLRQVSRRISRLPVRTVTEQVDEYYRARTDYLGLVEERLSSFERRLAPDGDRRARCFEMARVVGGA